MTVPSIVDAHLDAFLNEWTSQVGPWTVYSMERRIFTTFVQQAQTFIGSCPTRLDTLVNLLESLASDITARDIDIRYE